MSSPFLAEIRVFPYNFAPTGWAFCQGQLLPISQNTALFSLLGTNFGGNGTTNFGLPNLQGAVAMHTDEFSSGGQFPIGTVSGTPTVTLLTSQMPQHTHNVQAESFYRNSVAASPTGAVPATPTPQLIYTEGGTATTPVTMNPLMISVAGGGQPHNNLMPYLTLNYCIALQGIYPARN